MRERERTLAPARHARVIRGSRGGGKGGDSTPAKGGGRQTRISLLVVVVVGRGCASERERAATTRQLARARSLAGDWSTRARRFQIWDSLRGPFIKLRGAPRRGSVCARPPRIIYVRTCSSAARPLHTFVFERARALRERESKAPQFMYNTWVNCFVVVCLFGG